MLTTCQCTLLVKPSKWHHACRLRTTYLASCPHALMACSSVRGAVLAWPHPCLPRLWYFAKPVRALAVLSPIIVAAADLVGGAPQQLPASIPCTTQCRPCAAPARAQRDANTGRARLASPARTARSGVSPRDTLRKPGFPRAKTLECSMRRIAWPGFGFRVGPRPAVTEAVIHEHAGAKLVWVVQVQARRYGAAT